MARQLTQAIRRHDRRHPMTVGLIWIDNANPENLAGFPPADIAPEVDFLAVHVYPDRCGERFDAGVVNIFQSLNPNR